MIQTTRISKFNIHLALYGKMNSPKFLLFSDYLYPYQDDGDQTYQPYCPGSSGVTMDAYLTSNKVKKSHKSKEKYDAQNHSRRHVGTNILSGVAEYQSHGNGSTVKQLKSVFMPVADATCIPTLNVYMRKMVFWCQKMRRIALMNTN